MSTDVNYLMVFLATLAQFVLGGLWYSPLLFGKTWMKIMEKTESSKEELQRLQKEMAPFYALQFVITFVTTWVLANFIGANQTLVPYMIAFWLWLGFIAPIQIGSVIWANTKRKYWVRQIAIMTGMQLVGIMLAVYILTF